MSYQRARALILSSILLAPLAGSHAGCSDSNFGGGSESAAKSGKKKDVASNDESGSGGASGSGTAKKPAEPEDDEGDKANVPNMVAGAFLSCNMDATLDGTDEENVAFGCALLRDGKKVELKEFEKVDFALLDGKNQKVDTKFYKMQDTSAYHVAAPVPRGIAAEVHGEASLTVAGKVYKKDSNEDTELSSSPGGTGTAPSPGVPPPDAAGHDTSAETLFAGFSEAMQAAAEAQVTALASADVSATALGTDGYEIKDETLGFVHLGNDERFAVVKGYNEDCPTVTKGLPRFGKRIDIKFEVSKDDTPVVLKLAGICGIDGAGEKSQPRLRIREDKHEDAETFLEVSMKKNQSELITDPVSLAKGHYKVSIYSAELVFGVDWDDFAFSSLTITAPTGDVAIGDIKP